MTAFSVQLDLVKDLAYSMQASGWCSVTAAHDGTTLRGAEPLVGHVVIPRTPK